MRRVVDKKSKTEQIKLTPNKVINKPSQEFLTRFYSKSFERQRFTEQRIKSFNFFLIKQAGRITKGIPTIDTQLDICSKLLLTIIANLEQNVKNTPTIPYLNDTFYMMIDMLFKLMAHYNQEKVVKNDQWAIIQAWIDLFSYMQKWQNIPEPQPEEVAQKLITNLNWVDEPPEIEKNQSLAMADNQNLQVLAEWCCLETLHNNYYHMFKAVLQCYLNRDEKKLTAIVIKTIENAMVNRQSAIVDKGLKLFSCLKDTEQKNAQSMQLMFRSITHMDQKQKGVHTLRQFYQAVPLQHFFPAQKLLDFMMFGLQQIQRTYKSEGYKQVHKLLLQISKLSTFFTQVQDYQPKVLSLAMPQILNIVLTVKQRSNSVEVNQALLIGEQPPDQEQILALLQSTKKKVINHDWQQSICQPLQNIVYNLLKNEKLIDSLKINQLDNKILKILNQVTQPDVQKFFLNVLPLVIVNPPETPPPTDATTFIQSLILKLLVQQANKREKIQPILNEYLKKLTSEPFTNLQFVVCLTCLLSLYQTKTHLNNLISKSIQLVQTSQQSTSTLLNHLLLVALLINPRDYPILKLSPKDLVNHLLEKPQLLSQPMSLPPLTTNQTFLFDTKHTPKQIPLQLPVLTTLLNKNISTLVNNKKNLQTFYYILIELNNLCQKTSSKEDVHRPSQLQIIARMRSNNASKILSLSVQSLEKAIETANDIQIFHSLIKILTILQSNTQQDQKLASLITTIITSLITHLQDKYKFTFQQLLDIYRLRKKKQSSLPLEYSNYLGYAKDMQIVKFYSEAKAENGGRLHRLTMQVALKILLKAMISTNGVIVENNPILTQAMLLYQPVESPILPKDIVESPLFITNVMMYLISTLPSRKTDIDKELINQIRTNLQKDINNIVTLLTDSQSNLQKIIKFQENNFIQNIIKNLLEQQLTDQIFGFKMLTSLMDASPALSTTITEIFRSTNLLPKKLELVTSRIQFILKNRRTDLLQNSKFIYVFLGKIASILSGPYYNSYITHICSLDNMDDPALSTSLIKQIIQLQPLLQPNEQLASVIFQYLPKLYEYYKDQSAVELLALIPRLVCTTFRLSAMTTDSKLSLSLVLQEFEKLEKATMCLNAGALYPQSYFKCVDCDDKRLICHACTSTCHKGHAFILVSPSTTSGKNPCNCSSLVNGQCKLKKNPATINQINPNPIAIKRDLNRDSNIFRQFNMNSGLSLFGLPSSGPGPTTLTYSSTGYTSIAADMAQTVTGGRPPAPPQVYDYAFHNAFKVPGYQRGYNNPFDPREDVSRPQRFPRIDRYTMQQEMIDEEQHQDLFEAYQIRKVKRAFGQPGLQKRQIIIQHPNNPFTQPNQAQQPQQEVQQDEQSDVYLDAIVPKLDDSSPQPSEYSAIKSQSYLLQVFLQIAQELCLNRGRKASLVENESCKLVFGPPVIEKLCELSLRPFPQNNFKTRITGQGQIRDVSPMVSRKPIAIASNITLVLASTVINVLQNKRILAHILNKTPLQPSNHHNLPFQGHSIQFCPGIPTQFCVAGLHSMHVLSINTQDCSINKNALIAYSNRGEYINKIQYLQIGVMIGDTKSLKLIAGKTPSLVIHGAKDGGLIRDWHIVKLNDEKYTIPTYLLTVITPYDSIYSIIFDENDKGQKFITTKVIIECKKKGVGAAVYTGYLNDGRKYALFGFKDREGNNNIGRYQGSTIQAVVPLKFNQLHSSLEKSAILGLIERLPSPSNKMLFCCTLKSQQNRELSIHAGQLTIFSLSQDEKFSVQPLLHTPNDTKCQGFGIMKIDDNSNCILSLYEDGSMNIFVIGQLKKDTIMKAIRQIQQKGLGKDISSAKMSQQIRQIISDKIKLPIFNQIDLVPLIDFRQRALQPLKKDRDYTVQRIGTQQQLTIKLQNLSKVITGLTFNQSTRVTLPTRIIDNTLQLGFSTLEVMYFYAIGKIKLRFQKLMNGSVQKERLERLSRAETLQQEAELEMLIRKGFTGGRPGHPLRLNPQNEYDVFGENVESFLSRLKKLKDLISQPKPQISTSYMRQIFLILCIFLTQVRDTKNSLMQSQQLLSVVDGFKPLLLKVDCQYYQQCKRAIQLCIQIVNDMRDNPKPRFDNQLEPKTFTIEPLIRDIQNQSNCNYLLSVLYQMALADTQRFFFLNCKYRQLVKKIYKKYSLQLAKDDKYKGKDHQRPVEGFAQQLLCILIAAYSVLVPKKQSQSQSLITLMRNILIKYGCGKQIRGYLSKYLTFFYSIRPQLWLDQIQPEQENPIPDIIQPALQQSIPKQLEQPNNQLFYMQMDEQQAINMAIMESEKLLREQRFGQPEDLYIIQQEKMNIEDVAEIVPEAIGNVTDLRELNGNLLVRDLFISCIRSFENDQSMDTARYSIMIGYVLYKVIEKAQPEGMVVFLNQIKKFLSGLKVDKQQSLTTLCFLSLFSKVIQGSSYIKQLAEKNDSRYVQIKQLVMNKAREIVSKDPHPNKKSERAKLSIILKGRSVDDSQLSLAHSLMGLLRGPVELDPVILSLKCYWLLPKPKQQYRRQRDKVIYQQCMLSQDLSKIYHRATKRPDTWRESANIPWLEGFIQSKKSGWQQALQLLALYYDG